MKSRFNPDSKNVWIQDQSHPLYPNRVKIEEIFPDGTYRALVEPAIGKTWVLGVFREDQLSDDLIGG